ncbi:hypothetical protein CcaCcLH18_00641 [Colletotrichum camelliae]|nr:hypothetical protein CcaCcLH18_00641 [Colletotrichum camelliae]
MGKNRSGKASKAAKTSQTSSLAAQCTTSGVRDDPTLGFKIRALLHDLSNLAKDPAAARRLNNTTDEHYISGPYFSTEEAKAVKEAIVDVDFDGTRNPNANYEAEYTNDLEDGNEEDAETSRYVSRVQGKTVDTAIRMLMDNFLEKPSQRTDPTIFTNNKSKMAPRDRKTKSEGDSLTQGPLQLWFFLSESMTQSSWSQGIYTMDEIKTQDMSLDLCLKLSKNKGSTKNHSFWIASESMAAAVQLLSDESIVAMYNLYCKNDATVQIIIRTSDDPSPNASRTPSHAASLASRRALSASKKGATVPELFLQPAIRHSSGSTDLRTMEKIGDEDDMISFVVDGEVLTFTKDYLLGKLKRFNRRRFI